jgi:hypothetical protein
VMVMVIVMVMMIDLPRNSFPGVFVGRPHCLAVADAHSPCPCTAEAGIYLISSPPRLRCVSVADACRVQGTTRRASCGRSGQRCTAVGAQSGRSVSHGCHVSGGRSTLCERAREPAAAGGVAGPTPRRR